MSDKLRHIPVGLIANQVAKGMGLESGIPGLSSSLTLGDAADHYKQAKASAKYIKSKFDEKKEQLRDSVDERLKGALGKTGSGAGGANSSYTPSSSSTPLSSYGKAGAGVKSVQNLADQQAKQQESQEENLYTNDAKRNAKRTLNKDKKIAQDKFRRETQEAIMRGVKKVAKKMGVRTVSWAAGSTVVGLIVTYAIQSIQAIAGNLLSSKWIPKLDWWELIIWAIVAILIFLSAVVLMMLAVTAWMFANPISAARVLGFGIVSDIVGFIFD